MFAFNIFLMHFSNKLIAWYLQNKRSLPWRETKDPYAIWLSEIILQQTRVAQGLPYFSTFINRFPNVFALAQADEDEVLHLWQGLGYYSRARNMHETAQKIATDFQGIFPSSYKELLNLKGIGEYTAAAIASIAFDQCTPVVDGNVFRVLSRFFGIESDISSSVTKKEFQNLAQKLIPCKQAATFNQAIMDFGALQCTPKNPDCPICPFCNECTAYQTNKVDKLPVKIRKIKIKKRFLHYFVFLDPLNQTIIQQRTSKDIWKKLYEFPMLETDTILPITPKTYLTTHHPGLSIKKIELWNPTPIIHKLSHQTLHISFWNVHISNTLPEGIRLEDLKNFGFPIVIHNFIRKLTV